MHVHDWSLHINDSLNTSCSLQAVLLIKQCSNSIEHYIHTSTFPDTIPSKMNFNDSSSISVLKSSSSFGAKPSGPLLRLCAKSWACRGRPACNCMFVQYLHISVYTCAAVVCVLCISNLVLNNVMSNLISFLPAKALPLSSEPSGGAGTLPGPYLWPIHCHVVESIVLSTLWSPTCSRVPSESACAKYLLILFFLWGPDIRSRIIKYFKKSS